MMKAKWMAIVMLAVMLCAACASCALAMEPIEITSTVDHGDGTVTVYWNNPNGGMVTVGSLVNGSEEAGNRIVIETDIWGDSYTYRNLAPGMEHILLVMPEMELNYAGLDLITVKEPPEFDDFNLRITDCYLMYAVFKEDGNYSYNYAKDLSRQKMYDMLWDKAFLVRLDFRVPASGSNRNLPILTVVTSPTGYVVTDYRELEIAANYIGFWQTTAYMNEALLNMHDQHGEIPAGRYDVKVYVDGAYAGETSFTIK